MAEGVYYLKPSGSNSGVVPCDGQGHTGFWLNNTGAAILEVLYQTRLQPYIIGGATAAELVIYVEQPDGTNHWILGVGSNGEPQNVGVAPPGGYRVEAGGKVWISVWGSTTGSPYLFTTPSVQGLAYVHYKSAP